MADGKIGSGLNVVPGDGVFLISTMGPVDSVSYGGSTAAFNPAVPGVGAGHSLERSPANNDTNRRNDWRDQPTPNPGSGNLPQGLSSGAEITIVYAVEINCAAVSGQLFARAGFEQPIGTATNATGSAFLTVNIPDLVVTKTPIMQEAGEGDEVVWTVRIANEGFGTAQNVVASDRLGPGLAFTGFDPTPANATVSNAVWDSTVIPALASLAPGAYVDIVVTAQVVACKGLFNHADAKWGCQNLQVLANEICEDTSLENETATAGIRFLDRFPSISYAMDPSPILVDYCAGTEVTLYITNASGAEVGTAYNMTGTPVMPPGWSLTGDNVISNVLHFDPLPAGTATSVTFRVNAGGCPISTNEFYLYFRPYYEDACGTPFTGPIGVSLARVINPPSASVTKIMPTSVSGDDGSIPVTVRLSYTNFTGSETITVTDVFPAHTNLTAPQNITGGGTLTSTSVVWTVSGLSGSGTWSANFDMGILEHCGGPRAIVYNTIYATTYTDCKGCERTVTGSGERYPVQVRAGIGCETNACSFSSAKFISTTEAEVCEDVIITHVFSSFTGSLTDWTGVTFFADLAENGWTDTNAVRVWIDSTDVTSYVAISTNASGMTIGLSGLNGSPYPDMASVTSNLRVIYQVASASAGRQYDYSYLSTPQCGTEEDIVSWLNGAGRMAITLKPVMIAGACATTDGEIDLAILPLDGDTLYPVRDVVVTLNLDYDGNNYSAFHYEPGSTVFHNIVDPAGNPITASEPTISPSGYQWTWHLGDVGTNNYANMSITYKIHMGCTNDTSAQHRAEVRYNDNCSLGQDPPARVAESGINGPPLFGTPVLFVNLQPEMQFLVDTQIVNKILVMNTCAIEANNLRVEIALPPNVSFAGAQISPSTVTATNVVWDFHTINQAFGPLQDMDGDGSIDDLPPRQVFEFWVTNNVDYCAPLTELNLRASYGCYGGECQVTPWDTAGYESISGSLVTRATFPVTNELCGTSLVVYSVRNSGLTVDYDVITRQTLPAGISYVGGSSQVSINGGALAPISDPSGSGLPGDPLVWDSSLIPLLAAMPPTNEVAIHYNVALGCEAVSGDNRFIAEGVYTDLCDNILTNREIVSVLAPKEPLLVMTKTASMPVADADEEVVYTITISHDPNSAAPVPYLKLTDVLPSAMDYVGASVLPDSVTGAGPGGQTLEWSATNLLAQIGDGLPPFALNEGPITILVTAKVVACEASVINQATLDYGCSAADACIQITANASIVTSPRLQPPGVDGELVLDTCGGTKTVLVTNSGASTAFLFNYTEWAPAGYVFTGASVTGEFNASSAELIVSYSGTPHGSVAHIDFSTKASSGATDAKDDAGDGIDNLDLGKNSGFVVTWTLRSTGENLDCLADPTDLDFEDPEQGVPSLLGTSNLVTYTDLCHNPGEVTGSTSTYPDIPDLDIDLQPNSLIVTNGEVVNFKVTVINDSETVNADGIYVRVLLGEGWTNVTYVSSNIVSSGANAMTMDQVGDTNLLFNFPGVILNPINDIIEINFTAQATTNGGALTALAEVVGDCGNSAITPSCTFTNTLGGNPLANTMQGSTLGPVNGQYYSFDQDSFAAAGLELTKTVRYDEEPASAAGTERDARVGEDLIYRIEAFYFGGTFTNVTISDSLPLGLHFGTPTVAATSGGITGGSWDAGTGVFTLAPTAFSVPSSITLDIPVVVSNMMFVQDGVVITNVATTHFEVDGVTNSAPEASTEVEVLEPNLKITKVADKTSNIQAGDIITFTNIIEHTDLSRTSAYSVVFTDVLPAGLQFNTWVTPASGQVLGQSITVDSTDLPALAEFKTNAPPIAIVFTVLVQDQIIGSTATNISVATYESLDSGSKNGNERDGSDGPGGLNDYYTDDPEVLNFEDLRGINKTFVSSSQQNTHDYATSNDWTIGERFIYQIRVDMPQGVVTNLVLTDTVPVGIDFVGTNPDAALAYPGKGYEFEIPAGGPQFVEANVVVTDPDPSPASSVDTNGSGRAITFTFPAITNAADGNATNDYFLLRMEFVALDMPYNAGLRPNPRMGSNVVSVTDGTTTLGATGPVHRIVEHDIRVSKSRTPLEGDAGDPITFTIVASNHVNALANAYKVVVRDYLTNSVYDVTSFTSLSTPPGWTLNWQNHGTYGLYELSANEGVGLAPGTGVSAQFSINLAQTVRPNQVYQNTVTIPQSSTISNDVPTGIKDRQDGATNMVPHGIPGMSVSKILEATSETNNPPDSTGSNVQIGEVVTYRIGVTMPESTITNLSVVDHVSNNGLAYIYGSARLDTGAWGPNAAFVGNTGNFTENPSGALGDLAPLGQAITFGFTNVVVTGDNNTTNNTFYILADYLVRSNAVNNGLGPNPTVHTNHATLTYQGNPGNTVTSAVVTTTVIEPKLEITKSLSPTNHVDAGDIISVTLVVTNSGTGTAYDVVIEDELALPYFDISTLANVIVPTGFVHEVDGDILRFKSYEFAPTGTNTIEAGETLTFTFDVHTGAGLPPNSVVTNTATVKGDSIKDNGPKNEQRDTNDEDEDQFTSDDFHPTKALIATSETGPVDSTGNNLQIGEVATYEIKVNLPEGVIPDLTITDVMPAGMAYVVGSATVDASEVSGAMGAFTVTPNVGVLGASGENVVMTWQGNSVITASTNHSHTANVLRVTMQAVMMDLPANSGLPPQTVLTNKATVTFTGNPNPPAEIDGPPVTAVEPDIAIFKTVSPTNGVDAGDEITITLVATNSGTATAYDLVISDVLSEDIFNLASVTNVSMPAGFVFATTPGAGTLTVTYSSDPASSQPTNSLEVGESLEFVFTVHASQAVEPNSGYTNTVSLRADTIDGTPPTSEEREYTEDDEDDFDTPKMSIAKVLTGTSENGPADSTGSDVQIGETATYRLTVTLPEATITNLTVVDLVPVGMEYVAGSVAVDTNGFGGTLPAGSPTVTTLGGSGDDITIVFEGNTVVTDNNDPSDNSFTITLTLLTLNVGSNTGKVAGAQTVLNNRANVSYDGKDPEDETPDVPVVVIEPVLAIEKTMALIGLDVVEIKLVVTNSGLATAFDVEIQDVLTTNWWDTDTITNVTIPDGFTFSFAGNPGDATVTIASDPASGQPTNSIEVGEALEFVFRATLIPDAPSPVTNRATVTEYSSKDGKDDDERKYPDEDDEKELPLPKYTLTKTLTSPLGRPAVVGETVTFTIEVANTGDVGLGLVPLDDTYDATYLSFQSASPAETSTGPGSIHWDDIGPIGVGSSKVVTVDFTAIESTLPSDTTNWVTTSPFTTNDIPLKPKTNEAPVEVRYAGFTLEKTRTSPAGRAAQIGEEVVFTITVVNTGEVNLVTVPLEDTYETAFLSYIESEPASDDNNNDGVINWANIGPLAMGETAVVTSRFTAVATTTNQSRTNIVVASPTTTNTPPLPPQTNPAPYEIVNADYTLIKEVVSPIGRAAEVGETVVFRLTVENTGEAPLVTVPVEDTYETAYLEYVSSVPASDDNVNDGVINWADVGPIAVGDSVSIDVTFTAVASTGGEQKTNTVTTAPTTPPDYPDVPPKTNEVPYEVQIVGYTLVKEVTSPLGRPANIGEEVVFTITVANTGEVALVTVPVEDTYETAYLSYVSSLPASDDNINDGVINWANIGPIPVGESRSIVATFTAVASTTNSSRTNIVVTAPETPPESPPVPPKTNEVPYEVLSSDYILTKEIVSPTNRAAEVGETVVFRLTVENTGEVELVTVPVEDTYETAYLEYVSSVPASDDNVNDGVINWTDIGPIPVGESRSILATFTAVASTEGDSKTNRVVTAPTTPPNTPPVPPKTNEVPYEVQIVGYTLVKEVTSPVGRAANIGEDIVFTITVANTGEVALVTVPVEDTYETAYLEYVSSVPASDDNINDGVINWANIGPIPVGGSASIVATFTAVASSTNLARTNIVVTAPETPTNSPPVPPKTNDVPYQIVSASYKLLKERIRPADRPAIIGEEVVFRITVENDGEADLVEVPVEDRYETTYLSYVGSEPASDDNIDDGVINWTNIGPLPAGATTSIVATFTAVLNTTEVHTNWVETAPETPPGYPPVPPQTNPAPYEVDIPARLGDRVWEDLNGDGIQDAGEPGIPGVKVTLFGTNGSVVATTVTDVNGNYIFEDLVPGDYTVHFQRPSGYKPSPQDRGNDDAVDSDADPTSGQTTTITLTSGQEDLTWDAGFYRPASVGDYVWLDENWDGVQDAGEAGIPNVRVELLDSNNVVIATTVTDLNGLYLFTDLPPGDYTVRVDLSSLPPQLAANPTYDFDGNRDSITPVTLQSGDDERRIDFGYNWNPDDVILGSIGDRVWVDTDSDGVQDPGEIGIPDVVLNLYVDDGTGSYTTLVATTTTDASGFYIFPNLPPNAYVVRVDTTTLPPGYVQTGDPDHFGADASTNPSQAGDNQTTTPIVLAPGDVFVNADFGYVPPAPLSNLGDLIYFDANADGVFNPADGDYAIPGVTVVLLDSLGNVIASTVTTGDHSATNNYLFTDLPAGTYTVWVNDTDNVLNGLVQTGDPDGGMDSRSTTTLDGIHDDLLQDHGYTPDGHEPLKGLIGDTVFLDRDNDGLPGPGEGIQGVTVRLYDDEGNLLATTVTDANGNYWFGGLDAGRYEIVVDTTTLPNGGAGLVNTVDPDTPNPGDSRSVYDLDQGEINLDQDFGYVTDIPNAIGGTIWRDCNADGILDPGEPYRMAGVGVVLRDSNGNVVGKAFTDADGDFLFEGLPDGTYTVDVVDTANILLGWWHSLGPDQNADKHSKTDPYTVSVAGGEINTTADFGYYLVIAEVGDYVWYDINGNGIQDGGEPGLANVRVRLALEYPDGSVINMETLTDSTGYYLFGNLLLDARYAGSTTNDPAATPDRIRFTISVDGTQDVLVDDGYLPTGVDMGDGTNDSREHSGTFANVTRCSRITVYDFGYSGGPLLAVIGNVDAFTRDGQTIVRWETIESWDTAGFWLEREVNGAWVRISEEMIRYPLFGVAPIVFEQVDPTAVAGETYRYRIVELEKSGALLTYGPYTLTVDGAGHTYEDWAAGQFSAAELLDPAISGRDADPDGDGLTNWQEFLAGTDPLNADSVLRVVDVSHVAGGTELRWNSVPGRSYRIAVADSMGGEFLPVSLAIEATGAVTTYVVPSNDQRLFFQVILVTEGIPGDSEP